MTPRDVVNTLLIFIALVLALVFVRFALDSWADVKLNDKHEAIDRLLEPHGFGLRKVWREYPGSKLSRWAMSEADDEGLRAWDAWRLLKRVKALKTDARRQALLDSVMQRQVLRTGRRIVRARRRAEL